MKSTDIAAIDLFCGAGGLTNGLESEGFNVLAGIDNNPDCEYAYSSNNKSTFISSDITQITPETIHQIFCGYETRMLCGCAPCQPFSCLTQKDKNKETDPRWSLLYDFSRLVNQVTPELVLMENVPQLLSKVPFIDFISCLKKQNYSISYKIIECEKIGIPQKRKRLVLVASKIGTIELTDCMENKKTVFETIGHLEPLNAGEQSRSDPLHRCQGMSEVNLERIKYSRPGGSWKDWPEELVTNCHKKKSGASFCSAYSRMEWFEPSPTITTQFFNYGSGRFGHPEQNRALSLREGAMLQTFPPTYNFTDSSKYSMEKIAKLIGNAVPVELAKYIGRIISNSLN